MGCGWPSLLNINLETRNDGYVLFEESSLDSKRSGSREKWSPVKFLLCVYFSKIGGWTFKSDKDPSSIGGKNNNIQIG